MIPAETRKEWRRRASGAMCTSALDEYCPEEFLQLLDAYEALLALQMPTWYCGCGHTNGANLALCAACGRTPLGRHP